MPSINGLELPTVKVDTPVDIDKLTAKLAGMPLPVEAMIELVIYLKREQDKAAVLAEVETVVRGRIAAAYEKLPAADRDTRRTEVGLVTYTEAGEKVELKDRDFTVENLTTDQIRITYKPDIKALETILKPDEFNRHVKRSPTSAKITLRETKGSKDYHELDFDPSEF